MAVEDHIRNLYTPVQPTVRQSADAVIYREFLPDPDLQTYIYCYWELKTAYPLSDEFNYRVVADGCIDIFFEVGEPEVNFVMGFCKQYTQFPLSNSFRYVGIRFLPTMFPQLFGIDAAELSNQYLPLKEVLPTTASYIANNFHSGLSSDQIKTLFDRHLISLLTSANFDFDHRLYQAIDMILKNYGVLNVEKELDTGLSPRQMRRVFKYYIGDTPKTFAKVVRFQNILRAKPSNQSLRQNKLFYDIGYYDQAHFIKDFKNFYGVTPSKAFGR